MSVEAPGLAEDPLDQLVAASLGALRAAPATVESHRS